MSEKTGSYVGVIVFAVILGVLAYFQFRTGNIIEDILAVFAVVLPRRLVKQPWALKGVCVTLLVRICVYFTQAWLPAYRGRGCQPYSPQCPQNGARDSVAHLHRPRAHRIPLLTPARAT